MIRNDASCFLHYFQRSLRFRHSSILFCTQIENNCWTQKKNPRKQKFVAHILLRWADLPTNSCHEDHSSSILVTIIVEVQHAMVLHATIIVTSAPQNLEAKSILSAHTTYIWSLANASFLSRAKVNAPSRIDIWCHWWTVRNTYASIKVLGKEMGKMPVRWIVDATLVAMHHDLDYFASGQFPFPPSSS